MGIGMHYTKPYHLQANDLVEQTNGSLTWIVRKLAEETGLDWDTITTEATLAYNISFHLTTKFSPFKMLYGCEPALPSLLYPILSPRLNESHETYVTWLAKDLIKIQTLAYKNVVANTQGRHQRDQVSRKELPTFYETKRYILRQSRCW